MCVTRLPVDLLVCVCVCVYVRVCVCACMHVCSIVAAWTNTSMHVNTQSVQYVCKYGRIQGTWKDINTCISFLMLRAADEILLHPWPRPTDANLVTAVGQGPPWPSHGTKHRLCPAHHQTQILPKEVNSLLQILYWCRCHTDKLHLTKLCFLLCLLID